MAISTAVAAALLADVVAAGAFGAGTRAWSTFSVVSTPKTTGTPVSRPGPLDARRALAGDEVEVRGVAADHAPRQITASIVPVTRDRLGRDRQLERTRGPRSPSTSSGLTPGHRSPRRAPSSSRRVMPSLKRATRSRSAGRRRPAPAPGGSPRCSPPPCLWLAPGPTGPCARCRLRPGGRDGGLRRTRGHRRGLRGGGPCARAWSGGSGCSRGSAWSRAAPARRSRGRSPRGRRTWRGCWSSAAWW